METPNRVQTITEEMIKKEHKGPKMRTKGAETRGLVPFAVECAQSLHEQEQTVHSLTVVKAMVSLLEFNLCLGMEDFNPDLAASACRKFCGFYKALHDEAQSEVFWKLKPKLHQFQELAEYQVYYLGNPKLYWNYKDEDFVGFVAKLGKSLGGPKNAATAAVNVLSRYRMLTG